jgi:hypothetical protein
LRRGKGGVVYTGSRGADSAGPSEVFRIDRGGTRTSLAWRLDLISHSPTGLSWGHGGSGAAQCALAILADFLGNNDELAVWLHQDFKQRFVTHFRNDWRLTGRAIRKWLAGGELDADSDAYEEKARQRLVVSVVEELGGFKAIFDLCGHEVWSATKPPKETYCGKCISELVDALRKRNRSGPITLNSASAMNEEPQEKKGTE